MEHWIKRKLFKVTAVCLGTPVFTIGFPLKLKTVMPGKRMRLPSGTVVRFALLTFTGSTGMSFWKSWRQKSCHASASEKFVSSEEKRA